jgi:16S rRNA (cytidine1402-2'-O)-methyltransferase
MATVYLIPAPLHEEMLTPLPAYIREAILACDVFFAENERTVRRFFKKLDPKIIIDNYQWVAINEISPEIKQIFSQQLKEGKTIGIVSEAGCPGIADPGQELVALAHQHKAIVKPLVGPSSITLALMASGFNGQQFSFHGYLPVEEGARDKKIRQLEELSAKTQATQIFIETPYRNQKLLEALIRICHPQTRLCIAADLTSPNEEIISKPIGEWKTIKINLHKRPAIFLLHRG